MTSRDEALALARAQLAQIRANQCSHGTRPERCAEHRLTTETEATAPESETDR